MRSFASKEPIQNAYLELLKEKPHDRITISDVVARAKISRPTYYRHYYSPQEILVEIIDDFIEALDTLFKKYPFPKDQSPIPDGDSVFLFLLSQMVMCHYEHRIRLKPILATTASYILYEKMSQFFFKSYELWSTYFSAPLDRFVSANAGFRQMVTEFMCTGILHLINKWILSDCQTPPNVITEFIYKIAHSIHSTTPTSTENGSTQK